MLIVEDLYKTFNAGSVNEKKALKGISLQLEEGAFVSIIGGNGAGKSTLLNCIAGVYSPDKGKIVLAGRDVTRLPDYKRAGEVCRVFQDPMMGTAATMTIEENMSLALKRGQPRRLRWGIGKKDRALFREKLAMLQLGLEDRLSTQVRLLSGGQRQALTLLMTTLKRPKLALLDEHTASLDPKTALKVLALTRELMENSGITTLMVTHNMEQALAIGTRTVMMHEGKIILDLNGKQRKEMTVNKLVELFHEVSGENLKQDRLLLN